MTFTMKKKTIKNLNLREKKALLVLLLLNARDLKKKSLECITPLKINFEIYEFILSHFIIRAKNRPRTTIPSWQQEVLFCLVHGRSKVN